MLIIKDFFHKLYFKFSKSKFVKWLFPVFLLVLLPNVKASEIFPGPGFSFQIGSSIIVDTEHNSLPYNGVVYANGSVNLGALQISIAPQQSQSVFSQPTYNWLYLNVCASTTYSYLTMNISNSSTIHSYFITGSYKGTATGSSCVTQGYNGKVYLFQIPIGKWEYGEYSEWYEVASYNSFSSTNGVYYTISRVFLSDEDIIAQYTSEQALQDKLNSINTAITNMQNNITTNNNTNAQNIINNQNQNTNSVNNNIDDEFNKLKNQDHTYNQNASDNVPDSNNITSVTTAESDLLSRVNLDASSIDVTLSANTTNFIWDIVTNLRSTSGKITLLFTSILSLAIIKMVLNR